jgi:hypothetical protein
MPTAAWIDAPASWPELGLSNSQTNGVETIPPAANTMTVIFHPCVMGAFLSEWHVS